MSGDGVGVGKRFFGWTEVEIGELLLHDTMTMSGSAELAFQRHPGFGEFPLQILSGLLQVGEPLAVLADYVFEVCRHCFTSSVRLYRANPGCW